MNDLQDQAAIFHNFLFIARKQFETEERWGDLCSLIQYVCGFFHTGLHFRGNKVIEYNTERKYFKSLYIH